MQDCMVCQRIESIKREENPFFVQELKTGYVVLGDSQRFRGYTLFLCKECKTELHFLPKPLREEFLREMALVAEAVYRAFRPEKLHYELLGTGKGVHMHWHLFPRRPGDTFVPGPVWRLPKEEMNDPRYAPSESELKELKGKLLQALAEVLAENEA